MRVKLQEATKDPSMNLRIDDGLTSIVFVDV